MKFRSFIDRCVSNEIVQALREDGHDVFLLRDFFPIRSPDPLVIAKAQYLQCALVSLNGDFADMANHPPDRYAGVIAIQLHNHPEIIRELMASFTRFLKAQSDPGLFRGRLFVVEVHRIRIRPA